MESSIEHTDLLIIGSGMAGMSAALFAAGRKIDTILSGGAGGFEYASGLLDLWGSSLERPGRISKKPWDMLKKLSSVMPQHPLSIIKTEHLDLAFKEVTDVLKGQGLTYTGYSKLNTIVVTPFGTERPCYRVPLPMKANALAWKKKEPCLVFDFKGLREFSAVFFKEAVKKDWKKIKAQCIRFPGTGLRTTVFTPFLARSLETEQVQKKLVKRIRPFIKDEAWVGLPAVLGIESNPEITQRMEKELGVSLFEIPTTPVSVPGMRLKEAMTASLEGSSVRTRSNHRVTRVLKASDTEFECVLGSGTREQTVRAKAVILATGRFLSNGLKADQNKITESVFDLPVYQPETRTLWHSKELFNPEGHPVNKAGLETDSFLRPVDTKNQPVLKNLFAVGGILAHQDWMRNRCGASLSIGTAYHAIHSYLQAQGVHC